MQKLSLIVPEELSGKRLDQALASLYPEHSRSRLQSWIKEGHVRVNNTILRQKDSVLAGQSIEITPVFEPQEPHGGEAIPLDIVFEDEAILVINKQAGLVVHPGAGNPRHTLLNALLFHDNRLEIVPRAGIIHRLDKDTSGIMVIAKTPQTHTYLVEQMRQRNIYREYQAVVTGLMTAGGTVNAPISRHHVHRKRMAVTDSGKVAITHYRILKKFRAHTHLQIKLETGRTHQIRVHMAHLHHPIVGDPTYGGRNRLPKNISESLKQTIQSFPRQALHACRLTLNHPLSGEEVSWSGDLPDDIQSLLAAIENGNG